MRQWAPPGVILNESVPVKIVMSKIIKNIRGQNWTFTLPNYTEAELDQISNWDSKYLIYGFETCPKTGTPHLQGYVVWNCVKKIIDFKKIK